MKMEQERRQIEKQRELEIIEEVKRERKSFIEELLPKTKELYEESGVLPSITLAQAILESDWGRSTLASKYNNLFGIKAGPNEPKVHLETQEFENGSWKTILADFKVYQSKEESLADHTKLFVNGTTWNHQQYQAVLQAKNYHEGAQALQDSGYATDPSYKEKIIQLVEQFNLSQYD